MTVLKVQIMYVKHPACLIPAGVCLSSFVTDAMYPCLSMECKHHLLMLTTFIISQ